MNLNQPYYIEQRQGIRHIDLNGEWEFFYADTEETKWVWKYQTTLPNSVYHSLSEAGIIPNPYQGTNSQLYSWVDEKVWYYRKKFTIDQPDFKGHAFLCFDGVFYYCRVWVNGHLLGEHEGMFGSPVADVAEFLDFQGENELVVEVKACNYGQKDSFDSWNKKGENHQIVPWNLSRDSQTSTGDFIVLGIWNRIRLELVGPLHISRPYCYTKYCNSEEAELFLEFEIADGQAEELKPFYGYTENCYSYTKVFDNGVTGKRLEKEGDILIKAWNCDCCYLQSEEIKNS